MNLLPTFYFRPLPNEITLSYTYQITLRNPKGEELPVFQKNIEILCHRLSDSEKRRILYTLYPFGISASGSLDEIFLQKLAKIWVLVESKKDLPFEEGLVDYGYLCGYTSDHTYLRNPASFVCDIRHLSDRQLLRALKKELPKAAEMLINPSKRIKDLDQLEEQAGLWDGLLAQSTSPKLIQLARTLRTAHLNKDIYKKFIDYCIALELLIAHNPSHGASKSPINKQFASKAALVRHLMIKLKNQNTMIPPIDNYNLYKEIYEIRSQILHGRFDGSLSKLKIAQYLNELYPTLRLVMELHTKDPLLLEFLYQFF
ncbi:MAG: hypothetical protein ACRCTJ_06250 [Brevinema sp.]